MPAETHTQTPPPDPDALALLAVNRLAESLGIESSTLTGNTRLDDVAADEMVLIDVLASLGEDLGERTLSADDDVDIQELETVGDVADYVVRRFS